MPESEQPPAEPQPHPLAATALPARILAVVALVRAMTYGAVSMSYVMPVVGRGLAPYDEMGLTRGETALLLTERCLWPLLEAGVAWLAFEYAARVGRLSAGDADTEARSTLRLWFRGMVVLDVLVVATCVLSLYVPRG